MWELNDLSWFLYLADVLPRFADAWRGFCMVAGIITVIMAFIHTCVYFEQSKGSRQGLHPWIGWAALVFIAFTSTFSFIIPSKDTFYLIAGSEAGEIAVESERGQELMNKVNAVLDAQLERLSQ